MPRPMLPILLGAAATLAPSSAHAANRAFPVGGFDRISTSVPFDVHVRTGAAPGVRAEGPQEALDRLRIEVRGGELVISSQRGRWFSGWSGRGQRMVIEVSAPMVRATTVSGPGDLTVDRVSGPRFAATLNGPGNLGISALQTGQLDIVLNGPGDVTLAGRAETANLVLHGPGDIRAGNLTARDAVVQLSGPGDVVATVTGTVRGTLSGPGDITIRGGARCDIARRGPGDVHCR